MAITKSLTTARNISTGVMTVTDGSTYTSPTRATCGVFVKVYKVDYDGNKLALTTTGNNSDANTDSSWTCLYTLDGWYKIAYVAIPDYGGGVTYAIYDAVFDPATKLVYRSKANDNLGNALNSTTHWELISDPASLAFNVGAANQSVNLNTITGVTVLNSIFDDYLVDAFGTQAGIAFLESSSDYKRSEDVRLHELLALAIKAIEVADARQEYSEGEIFARRADDLI